MLGRTRPWISRGDAFTRAHFLVPFGGQTPAHDDGGGARAPVEAILRSFVRQNLNCHNKRLTTRVFDEVVRPMLPQLTLVLQAQVRGEPQRVQNGVVDGFERYVHDTLVGGQRRRGLLRPLPSPAQQQVSVCV